METERSITGARRVGVRVLVFVVAVVGGDIFRLLNSVVGTERLGGLRNSVEKKESVFLGMLRGGSEAAVVSAPEKENGCDGVENARWPVGFAV
jgi:hypothetical protein